MMYMFSLIMSFFKKLWFPPIREAQKEYRKSHILNKYDDSCWKDDIFW